MRYDLSKEYDLLKAQDTFNKMIDDKSIIELKKYREKRTNDQNAYFHVLITIIAIELGYTVEEAKIEVKRALDFTYTKNGKAFLKQTRDLNTKDMSELTTRVRDWASKELSIYLPSPEEYLSGEADNYIANNKLYI